jgi:hypothetical protein
VCRALFLQDGKRSEILLTRLRRPSTKRSKTTLVESESQFAQEPKESAQEILALTKPPPGGIALRKGLCRD